MSGATEAGDRATREVCSLLCLLYKFYQLYTHMHNVRSMLFNKTRFKIYRLLQLHKVVTYTICLTIFLENNYGFT
jgi:hypothetical protein